MPDGDLERSQRTYFRIVVSKIRITTADSFRSSIEDGGRDFNNLTILREPREATVRKRPIYVLLSCQYEKAGGEGRAA